MDETKLAFDHVQGTLDERSPQDGEMMPEVTGEPSPSLSTLPNEPDDEVEFIEEVTRVVKITSNSQGGASRSIESQTYGKRPISIVNKTSNLKNPEMEESGEEKGMSDSYSWILFLGGYTRLHKELLRLQFDNPGEAMLKTSMVEISQGRRLRRRAGKVVFTSNVDFR